MVLQVIAIVVLPVLMLIVASPPFDDPIKVEPSDAPPENTGNIYAIFFILWMIWILILIRTAFQVRKGSFRIKKWF